MYEQPLLHGDRETVQRKLRGNAKALSSHKPGYVMESQQRNIRGRRRCIAFVDEEMEKKEEVGDAQRTTIDVDMPPIATAMSTSVEEADVPREEWALRRMPSHCARKCFGMVGRKNCNKIL